MALGAVRWLNCRLLSDTQKLSSGVRDFKVAIVPSVAYNGRRPFSQTTRRNASAAQEAYGSDI